MMAHVLFPELDPDLPASLSPAIVDGILRRELGYEGVVLTDDLEMKAVADRWTPDRSAVLAMQAGLRHRARLPHPRRAGHGHGGSDPRRGGG